MRQKPEVTGVDAQKSSHSCQQQHGLDLFHREMFVNVTRVDGANPTESSYRNQKERENTNPLHLARGPDIRRACSINTNSPSSLFPCQSDRSFPSHPFHPSSGSVQTSSAGVVGYSLPGFVACLWLQSDRCNLITKATYRS
ncbi:unnamed protein product [Victoria cruziana]